MPTEIEKWLFIDGLARRKFGIERIRHAAFIEFGVHLDRFDVEEIVLDHRERRAMMEVRDGDPHTLIEANRESDYKAMMRFGSRKLLEAINNARR